MGFMGLVSLFVTSGCLTGCSYHTDSDTSGDEKPIVTVSLAPYASLVSDIAGDRMRVSTLMPKGGDPETYDPTVKDIRRLNGSTLYLMAGNMPFEQRIASQLPANVKTVDLSEGIDLLYGTHSHGNAHSHLHEHQHGLSHSHEAGEVIDHEHHHDESADPHTWSSLRNGKIIVANIVKALSETDPDGAGYYTSRGARLTQRIDSLDAMYTAAFAAQNGCTFLIWHPSLSYLAHDYGLHQHSLLQENKEHSVKSLKATLDSASAISPKVLLLQPESDIPIARSTASSFGVPVETINPLNPDWMGEMIHTLDALTSSVK